MARLRITYRIPIIRNSKLIIKYADHIEKSGFKIDAFVWIISALIFALVVGIVVSVLLPQFFILSIVSFVVVLDVLIVYPYIKSLKRIDEIERGLPEVLKQMSDILKAGGTYEYMLREIAESYYGPLRKEVDNVLRKLEEGENFENAFRELSENVDSKLVKRTVTIIVDAIRAGAGLADVLEDISEDVRATNRLARERKARTMMQVIFMAVAGAAVAPMIFGFVSTIIGFLAAAASTSTAGSAIEAAKEAGEIILFGVQVYLFVMIAAASAIIALMREGRINKSIIYFPVLLFIAYASYISAQIASAALLGGIG